MDTPQVGMSTESKVGIALGIATTVIAGAGLYVAWKQRNELKEAAEAQAQALERAIQHAANKVEANLASRNS